MKKLVLLIEPHSKQATRHKLLIAIPANTDDKVLPEIQIFPKTKVYEDIDVHNSVVAICGTKTYYKDFIKSFKKVYKEYGETRGIPLYEDTARNNTFVFLPSINSLDVFTEDMKEFEDTLDYVISLVLDELTEVPKGGVILKTKADVHKWGDDWFNDPYITSVTFDIETTGLDMYEIGSKITHVGVHIVYATHYGTGLNSTYVFMGEAIEELKSMTLLSNPDYDKITHNGTFDVSWLNYVGIPAATDFDTMIAGYLIDVNSPHNLKYMGQVYLKVKPWDILEIKDDEETAQYCMADCKVTFGIYRKLKKELETLGVDTVFNRIIIPANDVLMDIRARGVYVDQQALKTITEQYEKTLLDLKETIMTYVPVADRDTINLNSSTQIGKLLYEDLRLPIVDTTPTGKPSTARGTLLDLAERGHVIAGFLNEYGRVCKSLNGFLYAWREILEKPNSDGRLHTQYNIARTTTGRLSAQDPNLQQVPRDKNIRTLISAPPGKVIIEADYSQVELRVASYVAQERNMQKAYNAGEDLHTKTAAKIMMIPTSAVTKAHRTGAKAVNFGYIYGMGWSSFKEYAFTTYGIRLSDSQAQAWRDAYFTLYPDILTWHESQRNEVRRTGKVRTATGRVRHLPGIYSTDKSIKAGAERQAINTPVQSLASDITLGALVFIQYWLDVKEPAWQEAGVCIVGQIHDAILVECPETLAKDVGKTIKRIMESMLVWFKKVFGIDLGVPLIADVSIGTSWGNGKEI